VNGGLPGPVLRWRQGDDLKLSVKNNLAVDSSIHWHGIILPPEMDGVPGISYAGIKPGERFDYRFKVMQSGTYWYHSHSEFQEQTGLYGALIVDPIEPYPYSFDREYVVMLSDWSDEQPEDIFSRLKKQSHYYNTRMRTVGDLRQQLQQDGLEATWQDRRMWNRMRMLDTDISDVTGLTYTFLVNGQTPDQNWSGLFTKGEKVLLRVINASAMTLFDFRVPGLKMTVVAADGQYVEPVTVDEFRIGTAETYDVIVEPDEGAYSVFAQAIDRSGYARGTLTESAGLTAPLPELDPAPILTHADMGMGGHGAHGAMAHDMHASAAPQSAAGVALGKAGFGSRAPIVHAPTEYGFHVDMRVEEPLEQLNKPGIGMGHSGRRVLAYADLCNLHKATEIHEPQREIQLHLTGNMQRYMWSIDGIRFADAAPLQLKLNERIRIVLVNDTMMNHPIHLHGMWSELETGEPERIPLKHTILVQPGAKISYLVRPEIAGSWAYHCHLLYHMMGMFRRVEVS
jgi:CopA family copper-resistance protein